jgi:hypothetical protein
MEYRTISDVAKLARLSSQIVGSVRSLRRERLERLADLLDAYKGPIRVLKRMEHLSASDRAILRADPSPLTIAFQDPAFRAQGLASDRLGDARDFFALSEGQAHHLLCDCHYPDAVTAGMIAARARAVARRPSLSELWGKFCHRVLRLRQVSPNGLPMAASKTSVASSGAELAREEPAHCASPRPCSRPGPRSADRFTSPDWVDVGIIF